MISTTWWSEVLHEKRFMCRLISRLIYFSFNFILFEDTEFGLFQYFGFPEVICPRYNPVGIHSMQGWTATTRHGFTRKKITKRLKHIQEICLERTYSQKVSVNSRLKVGFNLRGHVLWFITRFWIFTTEFFVILSFFTTR